MKTLALSEETHKQLMQMKLQMGYKTVDELEKEMIVEFRKNRLIDAGKWFRGELRRKKLSFDDFLEISQKVRRELADEYSARRS